MKRLLLLFLLLSTPVVSAETLETLDAALAKIEQRQSSLQREYLQEQKKNEERRQRIGQANATNSELQQAYASAAKLEQLNTELNQLSGQHQQLCNQWRALYGPSVDAMLAQAEKERDASRKAEIGRRVQRLQGRNLELCAESLPAGTLEWKSLQIEPYDGPVEIEQKTQLLKDISREMTIRLSRLENQFQQAQREHRTRERAQEFVQEGTLFDQSVSLRSPGSVETFGSPRTGEDAPAVGSDFATSSAGTDVSGLGAGGSSLPDWQPGSDPKKMKAEYKKRREDLLDQQKELQNRIREFEELQKALLKP